MHKHPTPRELSLSLAWEFTQVLPGDFMRDRPTVREKRFPVLGPRPNGPTTQPKKNAVAPGPFIYFVYAASGEIKYIGKADERTVLYRWIRPDARSGLHQWSHGTNSATKKATVELIADEIRNGFVPVRLYFSNAAGLRASLLKRCAALGMAAGEIEALPATQLIDSLEHYLIHALNDPRAKAGMERSAQGRPADWPNSSMRRLLERSPTKYAVTSAAAGNAFRWTLPAPAHTAPRYAP